MGYVDTGGGPRRRAGHDGRDARDAAGRSVATLTDPRPAPADVRVTLAARKERPPRVRPGGRRLHPQRHLPRPADPARPGPAGRGDAGNASVTDGRHAALARRRRPQRRGRRRRRHPGRGAGRAASSSTGSSPTHAGTYWYHSHQVSHEQVRARAARRAGRAPRARPAAGVGRARARAPLRRPAHRQRSRGRRARRRPRRARRCGCGWSTPTTARCGVGDRRPFRVVAVDGRDVHGPDRGARTRRCVVTAGGRADLEVTAPPRAAACASRSAATRRSCIGTPRAARRPVPQPTSRRPADLRHAGAARLRPGRGRPAGSTTRSGAAPASSTGMPGLWWTINGHLYPDVPMFVVREGDVVTHAHREPQRRGAPDAPARPPRGRAGPQRRARDRQPVVVRLAQRRERRVLRHRVRRRQPGHLDGPLPQPQARRRGAGRPPDVRGDRHALPRRWTGRETPE